MDWFDLLALQGTLKRLLQHHSSKASVLRPSAFFIVQLSHPYMTTGKTVALTRRTFVGKIMPRSPATTTPGEILETRRPLVVLLTRAHGRFQRILFTCCDAPSNSFYLSFLNCFDCWDYFHLNPLMNILYFRDYYILIYSCIPSSKISSVYL